MTYAPLKQHVLQTPALDARLWLGSLTLALTKFLVLENENSMLRRLRSRSK